MRPGGQPNLQKLMKQAQQMQQQLAELAEIEVAGTAGGGLVTVTMSGTGEFRRISIDPKAVDPDDVETLEDLILAAIANAKEEIHKLTTQKMGPLAGLGGAGAGLPF